MKILNKEKFIEDYKLKFLELNGKDLEEGTKEQLYEALGILIREYATINWRDSNKKYKDKDVKQIYYFSMEFLIGRLLSDNLINLGIRETVKGGLKDINISLEELEKLEEDQGLGNGGLGRLAACFLDSMSSIGIPGHGCGIRYKYGFFEQKIIDGRQVEVSDNWLRNKNVWEIQKRDKAEIVKFGGNIRIEKVNDRYTFTHLNYEPVLAIPYDTPIIGYNNKVVNTLRLWSAEPVNNEFDFSYFNRGEFLKAIEYKNSVEAISLILYPEDSFEDGKKLRLKQEYFFVSAGLQGIIKNYKNTHKDLKKFNEHRAIHINDTHPTLAIPELMRILLDEENMGWDEAFEITRKTISYTNHTIMAEALEKWNIELFKSLLPRIYMIVEEINERYCSELWDKYPGDWKRIAEMSIIADGYIKMAHLAIVGSHSVNGVAKLHTEILKNSEMKNFNELYPGKFNNKTNGISHRRWLLKINKELTNLIKENIGEGFIKNPSELIKFKNKVNDIRVLESLNNIKYKKKIELSNYIMDNYDIKVDPSSIFDTQVKRIHGYKRQALNCFRILDLYYRIIDNPNLDINNRVFIFSGKAAPGYHLAKNIIELIIAIAKKVNNDVRVKDKIKVILLENYKVSLAEIIIPGTDVSEQISTTTKEASGTSNMKFMMNGSLTVATLDGANIEIMDAVGTDNIIIFGMNAEEVLSYYKNGGYSAYNVYNSNKKIKRVLDSLIDGSLSEDRNRFRLIYENVLKYNDEFFILKDFESYIEAQDKVDDIFRDKYKWQQKALINIASSGIFSSDRTIYEYNKEIWKA